VLPEECAPDLSQFIFEGKITMTGEGGGEIRNFTCDPNGGAKISGK